MELTDKDILKAIKLGTIEISSFDKRRLTPNGYDLSVGGVEINDKMLTANDKGNSTSVYLIPQLTAFRAVSKETVGCNNSIIADLYLKTKFTRNGIQATFGRVDAGFKGTLTFGMFNGNNNFYEIDNGAPIVQICFKRLDAPVLKTYEKRSGNFQNQKEKIMK